MSDMDMAAKAESVSGPGTWVYVLVWLVVCVALVCGYAYGQHKVTHVHAVTLAANVNPTCRVEVYDNGATDPICYGSTSPSEPVSMWPHVRCYNEDLDNGANAVMTLRTLGHNVDYVHGQWTVDGRNGPRATTEDSPVTLCATYPRGGN